MSLGRRFLRAAGYRIRQGIEEAVGRAAPDPARTELDDFLRRPTPPPPGRTPPPGGTPSAQRPSPPQAHPYAREYRLLGAPVGSDLRTVQACWRKLVRETHPDRFQNDPAEQQRANERLRRINEAYERLKGYLG